MQCGVSAALDKQSTRQTMFKLTQAAGKELKRSMAHHDFDDMPLRVAAQRTADGAIEYQMGFDEAGPGDTMFATSGIDVVIAKDHQILLNGTELDFVELDEGGKHFIFKNPNDPNFVAPQEDPAAEKSAHEEPAQKEPSQTQNADKTEAPDGKNSLAAENKNTLDGQ